MDDDDTIAPGWSLAPADICIRTDEFLTNGDVGIIPDPDKDLGEDLKAEAGEWGMPLQRELRATLHSYVNDRNDEHCGLSLSGSASERL